MIIIPFGEECYTCQSIDSKFSKSTLRKLAFPFDYVGHTYIENIYENIFDLIQNNHTCDKDDFILKLFDDKYFLCHKKYGYKYWHDIHSFDNEIDMDEYDIFIKKYKRRYERLKDLLKNKTITILSVNHFDNIYSKKNKQESIYKLANLLNQFNNNIHFKAVNFGEKLYEIPYLTFINLPVNYELSFIESKQAFTNELYNFVNTIV